MKPMNYLQSGGGEKYDLLKIILSVLIVLLHTRPLPGAFQPILRLSVPLFFVMTSFFFFNKIKGLNKSDKYSALKKFSLRNLRLYIFWFIVLLPITLLHQRWFDAGILHGVLRFIRNIVLGSTFPASWFITASIISVSLVTFASDYLNNVFLLVIGIITYLFCSLDANYHFLIPQLSQTFSIYHTLFAIPYLSFPVALVWIVIGKIIAENQVNIKAQYGYPALLIAFCLLYSEHYLSNKYRWVLDDDCYISLLVVVPLIFILISQHSITVKSAGFLRKLSTMIYCSHLSLLKIIDMLLSNRDLVINSCLLFLLCLSISVGLSVSMLVLEEKYNITILKYSH